MRLDYAITVADPKSVNLLFTAVTTKSELTKTDVMTSLGFLQSREPIGLSLILAKYTKDKSAHKYALKALQEFTFLSAPDYIVKKSVKKLRLVTNQLASIALNDYCRTADTKEAQCRCKGRGVVGVIRLPKGIMLDAVIDDQVDRTTQLKVCERCKGKGIRNIPAAKIYAVMNRIITIDKSSWPRHWQGYYNELLAFCYINESDAEKEFYNITKS